MPIQVTMVDASTGKIAVEKYEAEGAVSGNRSSVVRASTSLNDGRMMSREKKLNA